METDFQTVVADLRELNPIITETDFRTVEEDLKEMTQIIAMDCHNVITEADLRE
jgi:hypothetical protein